MRFQLSGNVQINTATRITHVSSAMVRGTLAALLIEKGNAVPLHSLVLSLWDDPPPPSAAKNLRLYVAQLRKQLRTIDPPLGDLLITLRGGGGGGGGYRLLVDADDVDVHRLARLATRGFTELRRGHPAEAAATLTAAEQLWKGPIGQDCRASSRMRAKFDRYTELHLVVQERLIEARLSLGGTTELVPEILSVIHHDPLREYAWAQLMRAYFLGGHPDKAYASYGELHDTLERAFGRKPRAEIHALYYAIVRGDVDFVERWRTGTGCPATMPANL